MKSNIYSGLVNVNSNSTMSLPMDPPTVYVNSYFIATHYLETVMASKHYYMGGQRIATNLISYAFDHDNPELELIQAPSETDIGYTALSTGAPQDLMATLDCLYGAPQNYTTDFLYLQSIGQEMEFVDCNATIGEPGEGGGGTEPLADPLCQCEQSTYFAGLNEFNCDELEIIYFYHPDYLGSIEFVTDMRGEPYQFFLNTPWGENLENQFAKNYTSFSSRFRFNGKEWDEETGNYYYGARYYDPKISVWLSVDPEAARDPQMTSYHFVYNNPLIFVDPNGLHGYEVSSKGEITPSQSSPNEGMDKFDVLYDQNGNKIQLTSKIISSKFVGTANEVDDKGNTIPAKYDSYGIIDGQEAESLYRFVAEGTDVEWSLFGSSNADDSDPYFQLSTTRDRDSEIGGTAFITNLAQTTHLNGIKVDFHSHSHPSFKGDFFHQTDYEGPSGFHHLDKHFGGGDAKFANNMSSWFPNARLNIYNNRTNSYIEYDVMGKK